MRSYDHYISKSLEPLKDIARELSCISKSNGESSNVPKI